MYGNFLWMDPAAAAVQLLTLRGHSNGVRSVAFSPDGRTLVTGGDDRMARLWDAATGRALLPPIRHRAPVTRVAFSPDGKWLAIDLVTAIWVLLYIVPLEAAALFGLRGALA